MSVNFAYPFDETTLRKIYVDGAWQASTTDAVIEGHSPVDGSHVFTVAHASEADVDSAVSAAKSAFDSGEWPQMTHSQRAKVLAKFAEILREHGQLFSAVWTAQTGTLKGMADNSPNYCIGAIDRNVDLAETYPFIETFEGEGGFKAIVREPVGVVAAIAPWNAPLATLLNKIAPALLAGCTIIMKPAPETPLEAYITAECAHRAGFPKGVINLVVADRDVSDYLVRHPGVDKVSFTGSVTAGKRIASVCADRIARVTLELGGKSAAIICDDADLAQAAQSLAGNTVMLSGQNCAALTRALVPADKQEAFLKMLVAELESVKIGDPLEEGVRLGPLAMQRQLDRVLEYIEIGKAEGARLVCGGKRPQGLDKGCFVEPTVFADVRNDMRIAQEEIFGPVLCVIPYDTIEDAIAIANDSPFGLAGGVYTSDVQNAYNIARKLRTGTVGDNGAKADFSVAFGGFKQSGYGREGGSEGLSPYLEAKTLLFSQAPTSL